MRLVRRRHPTQRIQDVVPDEALAAGGYDVVDLHGDMGAWARGRRPVLAERTGPGEVI
jgi:hypothetical protein